MKLDGKVAIVTGAASGIGRAIALRYAAEGARVVVADVQETASAAVVGQVEAAGGEALAVAMDVTSETAVTQGVARAVARFGRVDILVSNAGIQIVHLLEDFSFEEWRRMQAIHVDGAFLITRACLPHMYAQGGGTCIYMGSLLSRQSALLKAPYAAAKHALLGLARTVAREGGRRGVRANVICPGFVRTPLVEKQIPEQALSLGMSEDAVVHDIMLRETVDGEFTTLDDVAEVALFFAAFPSNALTGQSLNVSHGWNMQ
jgi:3-hydroxybutyrate dehydrogenase